MLLHHHLSVIAHSALDMQSMATSNHPAIFVGPAEPAGWRLTPNGHDAGTHAAAVMDWFESPLLSPSHSPQSTPSRSTTPPQQAPPPPPPNFGLTAPHFLSLFHPFVLKGPQPSLLFDPSLANSFAC